MSDLFPNAPLTSAIFQLRFAGEAAVEVARVRFQDAVRDRLPKLYVPRAVPGEAPALQGVTFRSEDEAESVQLAVNAFTYETHRYEGFAVFKRQVLSYFAVFSELVQIHRPTRAGLRYINNIPILRPTRAAAIPLRDYLNLEMTAPSEIGSDLTELNTAFTVRKDEGKLRISVQYQVVPEPPEREVLVLDFDFAQEMDLVVGGVEDYLDRAHGHTKRVFLALISDRYMPIMRGDTQ